MREFFEDLYARRRAIHEDLEEAQAEERLELLRELRFIADVLEEHDENLAQDALTDEWDAKLDRGEKVDLFGDYPEHLRRKLGLKPRAPSGEGGSP